MTTEVLLVKSLDVNTLKAYINDIPQLFSLGPQETEKLVFYMGYEEFHKGQLLFNEGDKGDVVYYIRNGSVDIVKESMQGGKFKLANIGRDGIVGEMALVEPAPRSATAIAVEDTEVIYLNRKKFTALLENLPTVGNKILLQFANTLSQRVRFMSGQLADALHNLKNSKNE